MNRETTRYLVGVGFAILVFACGFYALVPYPFELDDLVKGAMISLMTLSAQFVFGEALAHSVGRRQQQSFDAGQASTGEQPVAAEEPALPKPSRPDPGIGGR